MKIFSVLLITAAVGMSSLVMAEGGGDRTFSRMQVAIERTTQAPQLALQQQQETTVTPVDKVHKQANC